MDFKRKNGTILYSNGNVTKLKEKLNKKQMMFLFVVLLFATLLFYFFPIGTVKTSLDNDLRLIINSIPMLAFILILVYEYGRN